MPQTAIASITSLAPRAFLTAWQQQVLRDLLVDRLQAYRDRAAQAADALDDFLSSDSPNEREIARDTLRSLIDGVRDHENAIRRLNSGTFGVCMTCVRPIPFERLELIPEVTHCVECARIG